MRHSTLNASSDRDAGQMLLATGVVLLMSLLSMAIFGVKVAGLTPVSYTHLTLPTIYSV